MVWHGSGNSPLISARVFVDGEVHQIAPKHQDEPLTAQVGYLQLFAGDLTQALDPLRESVQYADETEDIGLRVVARFGLSSANWNAGQFRECLANTEQGLRLAQGDVTLGADRFGFSPSLGLSYLHGGALSLTGHPREAAMELDRVIELARTCDQLTPLSVSHGWQVLRCEVTGEAARALGHGREALDYAERAGNHNARIFAYFALGLANVLNRAWDNALEALEKALEIGRERRLLLMESGVLEVMAAAHLGLGDCAKAQRWRRKQSPSADDAAPHSGSSRFCLFEAAFSARSTAST
jgi:tetratricopeptide (TPR) repeat protein